MAYHSNHIVHSKWMPNLHKDWLSVLLGKDGEGHIKVNLRIPLDKSNPDEEEAVRVFGPRLEVNYTVNVSLENQAREFNQLISNLYCDERFGKKLTSLDGEILNDFENREALASLVEWGSALFRDLFVNITLDEYSAEDQVFVRKILRVALLRRQHIVIRSFTQQIPWGFLIDGRGIKWDDRQSFPLERFWGFLHELSVKLPNTNYRIDVGSNPQFLCAICQTADERQWHRQPTHPFVKLNGAVTNVINVPELIKALCEFNQDCFYFFGHAIQSYAKGTLALSGNQFSSVMVQDCEDFFSKKTPIVVFLNGCYTAPLTTWSADSMVGFLCSVGSNNLCCIGAVASVPNIWAALFAEKLWNEFIFNKTTIGEALRIARLHLWEEYKNPLGLLYTLFGRADTYIQSV